MIGFKHGLIGLLIVSVGLSMFGCGKGKTDDENTLTIEMLDAGYGTQFLKDMKDEFLKEHPGKKIEITGTPFFPKLKANLRAGEKVTTTDIFFAQDNFFDVISEGRHGTYDNILTDLTDVYDSTVEGENMSIREKVSPEYLQYATVNEKIYSMPWAQGFQGLVYNKTLFDDNGINIPRTTDELTAVADRVKDMGKYPFIHPAKNDYWNGVYQVWWAQYEGAEEFQDFFYGKNSVTTEGYARPEAFLAQGRTEALELLSKYINPDNGYVSASCNVWEFQQVQTYFINGEAFMAPNGDWLENESSFGNAQIRFMKIPVVSNIVNVLPKKTITTDKQLSDVIAAIDSGAESFDGVAQEDFDRVKEARRISFTTAYTFNAVIPAYSNAVPLAKEFLKFIASDKGLQMYKQSFKGAEMPYTFSDKSKQVCTNQSPFQTSVNEILKDAKRVYYGYNSPLIYKAGMASFTVQSANVSFALGTSSAADRMTAEEVIDFEYENALSKWNDWLMLAGLS